MSHPMNSLADYFFSSRQALMTARKNDLVYPLIAEYNMTYQRIDAGMAMLDRLMDADKQKTELFGKQLEAGAALKRLFTRVNPNYMSHVRLMKIKYRRRPERLERLMLHEPRQRDINGWLRQADTFYTNLINDAEMVNNLKDNGLTPDKLTASYNKIKEVELAHNLHREARGLSQAALETRDALMAEFDLWMKEFIQICKMALKEHPQMLEILGIPVLSKGYVRQKPVDARPNHKNETDTGIQIAGESPVSLAKNEIHG